MSQHGCPERLSDRSKGFQEDGPSQPTMEVLVETLTGTAFEMTVSPSDTIFAIKSKICRVEGIPVSQQHLVYKLRELEDGSSLRALGVGPGARLRLVLGMRGGPVATRRLPAPPPARARLEPWQDIERLLDASREEEWGGSSGGARGGAGAGAAGCRVTVLVYRDGERVNMLRVRENRDGTYSPVDHSKYSSSLTHLSEAEGEEALGSVQQNAVTMGKMLELRRRMETLSVRRRGPGAARRHSGEKAEMQKTRSEETLSVPSLLDEAGVDPFNRTYTPYSEAEDSFTPLYDGNYTRYDYDCSFADRYTLLPPIGTRTDSEQSMQDAVAESERLKLSELAGSILVQGRREEEAAILEECLDGVGPDAPQLAAKSLAPIPAAEYGPLVGGEALGWRVVGFGPRSPLPARSPRSPRAPAPRAPPPAHSLSASSLHAHAPRAAPAPPRHHPPLSDALFSSSTSDLEKLKRNRILPTLSRHRNREHLHLSDERLDAPPARPERLDAPPAERRARRIQKIAALETARLFRFGDFEEADKVEPEPRSPEKESKELKVKKLRIRCGFCKKKLSIATVHTCRCGAEFCAPHRYAEVHGCAYDYKANAHHYLQRANPLVSAPKLPKI